MRVKYLAYEVLGTGAGPHRGCVEGRVLARLRGKLQRAPVEQAHCVSCHAEDYCSRQLDMLQPA